MDNSRILCLAVKAMAFGISLAITSSALAPNFIVLQPDDLQFFEDWTPPAHFPTNRRNDPAVQYPGNSTLPNINRLRNAGLQMMQAYTASPKCGTSRYSTMTGRYPSRSSFGRNANAGLDVGIVTIPNTKLQDLAAVPNGDDCSANNLAQLFQGNGYRTGVVGKWHLTRTQANSYTYDGIKQTIRECGFNYTEAIWPENMDGGWYDGNFSHNIEYIAYRAIEFIEQNDDPFFLYLNPTVPHASGNVLESLTNFSCTQTPDDVDLASDPSIIGMTAEYGNSCATYRDTVIQRAAGTTENNNLGSIWIDDAIGAVISALERKNQLNNTFFLFQMDHGQEGKDSLYEAGVRIAQFIHYPDAFGTGGKEFHGMVSTIDIGPTMVDFAGIDSSSQGWYSMDGTSWKDAVANDVDGDSWNNGRCLMYEIGQDRAVRCGCDKYMYLSNYNNSVTRARGERSNVAYAPNLLFNLCDGSGNYITTPADTPELFDLLDVMQTRGDELHDVIECHLGRTDPDLVQSYFECLVGSTPAPTPATTPAPTSAPIVPGPPSILDTLPLPGQIVEESSFEFLADVVGSDINRVRFEVRGPDNFDTNFEDADQLDGSTVWALTVNMTAGAGKYRYRVEVRHSAGEQIRSNFTEFLLTHKTGDLIPAAREDIAALLQGSQTLGPKFVRLGFHDCVGGCDGCVDLTNGDNNGLDVPINALGPVVDLYAHPTTGMTRADIWAMAALVGSDEAQDASLPTADFNMTWIGRANCEDVNDGCFKENGQETLCQEDLGPHRSLPSPDLTNAELLHWFSTEFGYTTNETVAIMGAHTLGRLARENSGFDGTEGWVANPNRLDNVYYDLLVGGSAATDDLETKIHANDWNQVFVNNSDLATPDRYQWEIPAGLMMLNSDIALVRDLDADLNRNTGEVSSCQFRCRRGTNGDGCALPRCPYAAITLDVAASYKYDNTKWLQEFSSAFRKMLVHGYDTSAGCSDELCVLPEWGVTSSRKM